MPNPNPIKIVFVCLLLQLGFTLKAQLHEQYTEGSVEFQNGEKKQGFIKEDELAKMEYQIYFKAAKEQNEAAAYDTSTIKNVHLVDGEEYERLHLKSYYSTDSVAILARLLVKGKASLYKVFYKGDDIFIVVREGLTYALQDDKLEFGETQLTEYHFKEYLNNALGALSDLKAEIDYASFNDKEIIEAVSNYNKAISSTNTVIRISGKTTAHFVIVDIGGMIADAVTNEFYVQGIYRTYLPLISKSTSFNIGINYFRYNYSQKLNYYTTEKYMETLWSIPFQFQQNILNKNIRPYVFAGANLSYLKWVNAQGVSQEGKGFQNNYGVGVLYGIGIEGEVYKNIRLKTEYRNENFSHLITIGIGYVFLRN